MKNYPLPNLEKDQQLRERLLPYCRLRRGHVWEDPKTGHRVGCLDASNSNQMSILMGNMCASLAIQDPPYNVAAFRKNTVNDYINWCKQWIESSYTYLVNHSALYVWLGADQNNGFQPLPDFMIMMRDTNFSPRSFITMRNQRGYGTQKNWMAIRQELLYYAKGVPSFNVEAEYTDIPKILRGYYKNVAGHRMENAERGKADTIRAGNVWVDIQQVFYRLQENVNGCYAQKPLKAIERIISASSQQGDLVIDWFAHSGTTLIAAERLSRKCYTADIDPVYCEIAIRRLENYRTTGRLGWQNGNAFENELCIHEDPATVAEVETEESNQFQRSRQGRLF